MQVGRSASLVECKDLTRSVDTGSHAGAWEPGNCSLNTADWQLLSKHLMRTRCPRRFRQQPLGAVAQHQHQNDAKQNKAYVVEFPLVAEGIELNGCDSREA